MAMVGLALLLLVSPPYVGAIFIGGAIGAAIRIEQRRRARAAAPPPRRRRR
jgi:hypothetical protein